MNTQDKRGSGRGGRAGRGEKDIEAASRALGLSTGWNAFSYLIAGMLAYGGIGWLVGRAVHVPLLFPIGMIVGLGIGVGYVIYRYGRSEPDEPGTGSQRSQGSQGS
jgi:F0F1-type ATP synthase assembly protein I